MKNIFIVLCLLYSCLMLQANEVQNIYNDLDNLSVLPEKVAKVSNFSIIKDVANFHLKEGNLYLLSQVNEEYVAALFKGEGKVIIEPSTKFAKERLYSELQVETIDDSFEYLFLIFSKELYNELTEKLTFEKAEIEKDIVNHNDHCKLYLFDYTNKELYSPLLKSLLSDVQDGYFYAHIVDKEIKKPLFFEFSPFSREEVSISVRRKQKTLSDYFHEPISMFHRLEDYKTGNDLTFENKDAISVNKYKINVNITQKLDFSATCSIDFTGKKDSGKWLEFYLFPKMKINSVTTQNGDSLSFFKGDEHQFLWIELEETIRNGKDYNLTINYEGNIIERGGSIVEINSYYKWYPIFPTYEYNHYDLTFNFPASYDLVSIGEKISEEKIGKIKKSVWQTNHKVNYATFNMGKLKHEEFEHPSIPDLSLFLDKNLDNAKADVANSISFYQSVFGDCIYDKITVAEIPDIFMGIAFPGFINFYSDGFIKKALFKVHYDIDINEIDFVQLRSHEAAHQWWGCAIQPRTYRDIWLAEGLSEFSSIWFIQTSLKNNEDYFNFLLKWKTRIIDEHRTQRKEKKSSPPIWLGRRAPYYVYYQKAGWIFHMLRMLMIDLDTYNENSFKAMMQDFYQTYKGSTVSTEDFKNIVEKHIKTDMTWFFDQWIYGSEIPKLSFDYFVSQKKDGNFLATCKFQQDNVSEDFVSHIPIEIDFGNNQKIRRRILVKGNERTMEISLPQKPEKIVFNILDSVLSE